jgi:hypothetical protein
VSKSIRLIALNVLALALPLLLLSLVPDTALAQSQRKGAAVFGFGPGESVLLNQPSAPGGTPVWVDTNIKRFIESWTEYNPVTCTDISPGSYQILSNPTHGKLFFDIENSTLANGDCPGKTFPFAVARYTWTDPNQNVLHDPFTLRWKTPDGKFTQDNSWIAELAKIIQDEAIWWVCGVTTSALPNSVTLTLQNPPSGATSFVWTVTGGADKVVFSNGKPTITTTINLVKIKTLAASAAMKDVSIKVNVPKLSYSYQTAVRTPKKLKRRPDLDKDRGVGATCLKPGTQGFLSLIGYEIDDQFGVNTANPPDNADAGANEKFGAVTNFQNNNWPIPHERGTDTPNGLFIDNICATSPLLNPHSIQPQTPLTNKKVDGIVQTLYTGDITPGIGCKVQTDDFTRFVDHGRHLNIKPAMLGTDPATEATAAGSGTGYPMPVQNIRYLAGRSTVIVKGRVLQVNELGAIKKETGNGVLTFQETTASVQVDRVLKGRVEGNVIAVEFLKNPEALPLTLEENEYALLFLQSGHDGRYTFADPQVGKMPITSQNVPVADAAQTTADQLAAELFASLSDPNREMARLALVQVGNLGSVRSTQAIWDIATFGDADFQGLAHVALLRLGDYSLLDRAIRFAEQPVQDLEVMRLQLSVAEAIGDSRDRSVLPALNSLLASPSVSLRRAAAKALRTMSDPSSARFLVGALDDSDADVQYDAVMALADIVGASPDNAPARDIFDQDPAKYLGYWKNWRETSGQQ